MVRYKDYRKEGLQELQSLSLHKIKKPLGCFRKAGICIATFFSQKQASEN